MQTKQYDVCLKVLRRLEESGVLRRVVLVGSWCLVLYREYFRGVGELSAVRTRGRGDSNALRIRTAHGAHFYRRVHLPSTASRAPAKEACKIAPP